MKAVEGCCAGAAGGLRLAACGEGDGARAGDGCLALLLLLALGSLAGDAALAAGDADLAAGDAALAGDGALNAGRVPGAGGW